ncbi:hypothetical protein ACNHKD_09555 [Methylocystis sp. JAN1]|uniref:hypothetical protein n=1 Tax=Methylocystis sp. JAN1 TaxID=3397211 RepID=UPI003FA22B5A
METSNFAAFLKDSKPAAVSFLRRYHVVLWLVVASMLLTGLTMRPSEVTVVILALNLLLLWLAISLFKHSRTAVWLVVAAEIFAATQMSPNRATALVLLLNMTLMLGAIIAARLGAPHRED